MKESKYSYLSFLGEISREFDCFNMNDSTIILGKKGKLFDPILLIRCYQFRKKFNLSLIEGENPRTYDTQTLLSNCVRKTITAMWEQAFLRVNVPLHLIGLNRAVVCLNLRLIGPRIPRHPPCQSYAPLSFCLLACKINLHLIDKCLICKPYPKTLDPTSKLNTILKSCYISVSVRTTYPVGLNQLRCQKK